MKYLTVRGANFVVLHAHVIPEGTYPTSDWESSPGKGTACACCGGWRWEAEHGHGRAFQCMWKRFDGTLFRPTIVWVCQECFETAPARRDEMVRLYPWVKLWQHAHAQVSYEEDAA